MIILMKEQCNFVGLKPQHVYVYEGSSKSLHTFLLAVTG
jgi:hypothetical protein